jgi:hypothetical protein
MGSGKAVYCLDRQMVLLCATCGDLEYLQCLLPCMVHSRHPGLPNGLGYVSEEILQLNLHPL